jgi:CheY-like chemotaxis protein
MRILYIEDEPTDAVMVERYAKKMQHDLILVNNIDAATQAMVSSPDLILVDVLIGRDRVGYRFVENLRAEGYELPVIAVTGLALPEDVKRCFEAGFNEVLTKPYAITQLAELLSRYTQ